MMAYGRCPTLDSTVQPRPWRSMGKNYFHVSQFTAVNAQCSGHTAVKATVTDCNRIRTCVAHANNRSGPWLMRHTGTNLRYQCCQAFELRTGLVRWAKW